jgi:cyclohexanone monooxygenase
MMVSHARTIGAKEIEVTKEAEDRWIALLLTGPGRMIGSQDCTPGYYNNEGHEPGPAAKLNVGYPAGALAYFKYIDAWRSSGQFEGLEFR